MTRPATPGSQEPRRTATNATPVLLSVPSSVGAACFSSSSVRRSKNTCYSPPLLLEPSLESTEGAHALEESTCVVGDRTCGEWSESKGSKPQASQRRVLVTYPASRRAIGLQSQSGESIAAAARSPSPRRDFPAATCRRLTACTGMGSQCGKPLRDPGSRGLRAARRTRWCHPA